MAGFKRKVMRGPKGAPKHWAGTWEFRCYMGLDPIPDEETGEHRKVWRSTIWPPPVERDPRKPPGDRLAEKALAAWVTEIGASGEQAGTKASVEYAIETWLKLQRQAGLSPTTLQGYESILRTWIAPHLGEIPIDALTAGDLRRLHALMRAKGSSDSRIRQAHAIIRGTLRYCMESEWIDRNVAALVRPPKQASTKVSAPSPDEVNALWLGAGGDGSDLATCIALASLLGARLGELCGLRWSDVDLKTGLISFSRSAYAVKSERGLKDTKTHATGTVAIGELVAARLRMRRAWQGGRAEKVGVDLIADPFVLSTLSDGDGPPRPDKYTAAFSRLRTRLELPTVHLHSLRHFVGTHLVDAGVDLVTVAKILRHRDTSMIGRVYAHGTDATKREAAAILGRALAPPEK